MVWLRHRVDTVVSLPAPKGKLSRAEVINLVIEEIKASSYLEIGVNTQAQPGYSRDKIVAGLVHGVDPNVETEAEFHMTSDLFFSDHCNLTYDVIFIDGLHLFEQTYKDITNAISVLAENGVIVVHDTRPVRFNTQTRKPGSTSKWHGDVWRAIVLFRLTHPSFVVLTVDSDEGLTLIFRGKGDALPVVNRDDLFEWRMFRRNYALLLNLTSETRFIELFRQKTREA